MREIFLPGPFAETDLLAAILGPGAAPDLTPARLAGHRLCADLRSARVGLVQAAGAEAPGAWARVDTRDHARLVFALAVMGDAAEAEDWPGVLRASGPDAAGIGGWPEAPPAEWRAHLPEAAAEVMSQYPHRSVEQTRGLLRGIGMRALARTRGRAAAAPARARSGFSADGDVEALALERPYSEYFALEEHRLRHRMFDGRMSGEITRAVFASGDAVSVLPFDPHTRDVLLIEQFRAGPFARRDPHPWLIEAIAGRCDVGETPEQSARREASEEAGLALGRMARIAGYYISPGAIAEHLTAFVGEARLKGLGGLHGLDAEDEDIRVFVLPLAEAMRLVDSGEINNAPLLISLLWLGTNADRLAADWTAA